MLMLEKINAFEKAKRVGVVIQLVVFFAPVRRKSLCACVCRKIFLHDTNFFEFHIYTPLTKCRTTTRKLVLLAVEEFRFHRGQAQVVLQMMQDLVTKTMENSNPWLQ